MEKIKVLVVKSDRDPYVIEINNTLETMEKVVGGDIQVINLEDNIGLCCNEYGKINNLEMNRIIKDDVICGNFFISSKKGEEFATLGEKEIKRYKKYFKLRDHTIPIALLKNQYGESSNLLNYDLTGVEKLLKLGDLQIE